MSIQNNQSIRKKSIFLLFLYIISFFLISSYILINIDSNLFDIEMIILSILFFFVLTFILVNEKDKFTSIVFFSLLFYGYVFSGLYFSYYGNINTAKFFNFVGKFGTSDIKFSLFQVFIGYLCFVIGYKISNKFYLKKLNLEITDIIYKQYTLRFFLIGLYLISFFYWIYVSFKLAGGPIDLLFNMGQYVLFQNLNPISTTPYILGYVATYYLFIIDLNNKNKITLFVYVMILSTFIMYLSTGRLSGSVFYFLSFPLMYVIWHNFKINFKLFLIFILFILLLFSLYFYREYTNLYYLGLEMETDIFKLIGTHFFGMTNFGDLQSITFSNQYIKDEGLMYGQTFFDMTRFWLNKFPFINLEPTSIGLRLREYYFSNVETGAPAPGIISEMIINFDFFGITFMMFIFGIFVRTITNTINPRKNPFNLYVYTQLLIFFLLLPKVDSSHIDSLIWNIVPFYILGLVFVVFFQINQIVKKGIIKK